MKIGSIELVMTRGATTTHLCFLRNNRHAYNHMATTSTTFGASLGPSCLGESFRLPLSLRPFREQLFRFRRFKHC